MSWSEDFVKLLQSLPTAIKTTKCQASLSTLFQYQESFQDVM